MQISLFHRKHATTETTPATADPFADSDKIRGVQDWLEHTSLIPIFIITLLAIVFRSSFTWALGALNIQSIPPLGMSAINLCLGIAIALSTETIGSMAGRKWYVGWDKINLIAEQHSEASASLTKTKRFKQDDGSYIERQIEDPKAKRALNLMKKQQDRQKRDNTVNFTFMMIGQVASFYATMRYAFQSLDVKVFDVGAALNILQDSIISIIILAVVFYLGVIYEPSKTDDDEIAIAGRKRLRYGMVSEAFKRVKEDTYENKHIRMLMQGATPKERKELEAMMTSGGAEMWTTAQIAAWLGWEGSSKRREITRRLKAAFDSGVDGIMHDPDNDRNWIADIGVIPIVFSQEFKDRAEAGNKRTTLGQGSAQMVDADKDAGPSLRQGSDKDRRDQGPKPAQENDDKTVDGTVEHVDDAAAEYEVWRAAHEAEVQRLEEELRFIESAFKVAIENDPSQDIDALAARFNMPVAHARALRKEVLDRHLLAG